MVYMYHIFFIHCNQGDKHDDSAHDHILAAEDAPEGYEYSNINELMSTEVCFPALTPQWLESST